ncbi:hypothetical protein ACH4E9_15815 [Streptomyces anulatus]
MSSHNGSNNLTGNRPYNYQPSPEQRQDAQDEDRLFHVTVTGGDKDVLDTLISERNPEYSEHERANLLDRQDNMFVVAYQDRKTAERAVGLFQTAGAQVEVSAQPRGAVTPLPSKTDTVPTPRAVSPPSPFADRADAPEPRTGTWWHVATTPHDPGEGDPMPETDETADENQLELVVRKVDRDQDEGADLPTENPDETPGPEVSTRSNSMMTQGQM